MDYWYLFSQAKLENGLSLFGFAIVKAIGSIKIVVRLSAVAASSSVTKGHMPPANLSLSPSNKEYRFTRNTSDTLCHAT